MLFSAKKKYRGRKDRKEPEMHTNYYKKEATLDMPCSIL